MQTERSIEKRSIVSIRFVSFHSRLISFANIFVYFCRLSCSPTRLRIHITTTLYYYVFCIFRSDIALPGAVTLIFTVFPFYYTFDNIHKYNNNTSSHAHIHTFTQFHIHAIRRCSNTYICIPTRY